MGVTACDNRPNYAVVEIMKDNTNLPAVIQMEKNKYIVRYVNLQFAAHQIKRIQQI